MKGRPCSGPSNDTGSQPVTVPVKVVKTIADRLIRFSWAASEGVYDPVTGSVPQPGGYDTIVEMSFEPLGANETLVKIAEGKWRSTERGSRDPTGTARAGRT